MRLACPHLSDIPDIKHGFFTRKNGVSDGLYASLNCGPGSGDDVEKVMQNRARVTADIGAKAESLCVPHQIHSGKAVIVNAPWHWKDAPQADALVTNKPNITLGVLTADCLPILMADAENRIIAAVHAGWKGAFDGVIEAALAAMHQLGADNRYIVASIGPAIAQKSYEVGGEFYARFIQQDIAHERFFAASLRGGHYLFDLKAYAKQRLEKAGIPQINVLANDNCLEENAFFSFRRATLRKETVYGRQISVISLASPRPLGGEG
jgi:YfiH family protein